MAMNNVLVVVFDGESQAREGYRTLKALRAAGSIVLRGDALVSKEPSGQVVVRDGPDLSPSEAAERLVTGNMMGLLGAVGTVVAAEVLDRVGGYLEPGQSAVVAEVQEEDETLADSRLEAVGGKVYRRAASSAVDDQIGRDVAKISARIARLGAECGRARREIIGEIGARADATKAALPKARDRAGE